MFRYASFHHFRLFSFFPSEEIEELSTTLSVFILYSSIALSLLNECTKHSHRNNSSYSYFSFTITYTRSFFFFLHSSFSHFPFASAFLFAKWTHMCFVCVCYKHRNKLKDRFLCVNRRCLGGYFFVETLLLTGYFWQYFFLLRDITTDFCCG